MTHPDFVDAARSDDIAIVGLAGRFPGASTIAALWANLCAGVESISFFSDDELLAAGVDAGTLANPRYVKARAVLDDIDGFDAPLFGFSARDAEITDPQHRLFLECAYEALENAGYDPQRGDLDVGVFAGAGSSMYFVSNLLRAPDVVNALGMFRAQIGNEKDYLSSLVAYKLDLRGPAIAIQTACSSSLVAVHVAAQQIVAGECDMALAGGVSIVIPQQRGYLYHPGAIESKDGHCRAFDADASGTVRGNGVGVVVLMRLEEAVRRGFHVHAVIRATAANNDGHVKAGFTAPSAAGQARVIARALALADVAPDTIGYVETHGTGTSLGDPIEIEGLARAFGRSASRPGSCAIGSIKSNLGHLDVAAGVAGLIKATLAVREGVIPPTLHFRTANPALGIARTPFHVNADAIGWPHTDGPRRACVSSFGIGGTNAHVVIEQASQPAPTTAGRHAQLLVLSAECEEALRAARARLAQDLATRSDGDLADVAFTLQVGRRELRHRWAAVCADVAQARGACEHSGTPSAISGVADGSEIRVAFLYPGQGSAYHRMATALLEHEPLFHEPFARCAAYARDALGLDLYAALGASAFDVDTVQLLIVSVQYAIAETLKAVGIVPAAVAGHSVGEYAAACTAGSFSIEETLRLVAERGRLSATTPRGRMLAVAASEADVRALVGDRLSIAAINAPTSIVVAGAATDVDAFEARLRATGIESTALPIDRAFHSALIDPIVPAFTAALDAITPRPLTTAFVSSVTGQWIAPDGMTRQYWADHLRRPVNFAAAAATLLADAGLAFVEIGPGTILTSLMRRNGGAPAMNRVIVPVLPGSGRDEYGGLLDAIGSLWCAGAAVDWEAVHRGERRRRVELPGYPFQRRSYWVSPSSLPNPEPITAPVDSLPNARSRIVPTEPAPVTDQRSRVLEGLVEIAATLTRMPPSAIDVDATFHALGVDSLLLIQASKAIERRFAVTLPLARLFELSTLSAVAAAIAAVPAAAVPVAAVPTVAPTAAPAVAPAAAQRAVPPATGEPAVDLPVAHADLRQLFERQLQILSQQLEILAATSTDRPSRREPPAAPRPSAAPEVRPLVADTPRDDGRRDATSGRLAAFVASCAERTRESKRLAAASRPALATPLPSNFRQPLKAIAYSIVAARARGSRLWDVDGHEYIDITMGYGAHLFGHSPDFISSAVRRQMDAIWSVGPHVEIAQRAAELVCALTGVERVSFCNSGTEAVMGALRLARAATGRSAIALFSGSYHGWADATTVRAPRSADHPTALAAALGVPDAAIADVLVLPYATPAALETIERHAGSLAAVLVEPVQSRRPDLQPREFLKELRQLTARHGVALIFDEMVMGFRLHPGGAQAFFDVRADLVTYGKVLGGGLPIGAVGGARRFMDVVDGGAWAFEDASTPSATQTLFIGTFFKHPLAMAAACAVLERLAEQGTALVDGLNTATADLAARLNDHFARMACPIRVVSCGSLFRFVSDRTIDHPELLPHALTAHGLFAWDGGNYFLSTAHTPADVGEIESRVVAAVDDLIARELFPGRRASRSSAAAVAPVTAASAEATGEARSTPLTDLQSQIWTTAQLGPDAIRAYNESITLRLSGRLDRMRFEGAIRSFVERQPSLRATFASDGQSQRINPHVSLDIGYDDLAALDAAVRDERLAALCREEARRLFDLTAGPLIAARIVRDRADQHTVIITAHHIVVDGWSVGVMLRELAREYSTPGANRGSGGRQADAGFEAAIAERAARARRRDTRHHEYWRRQFAGGVPTVDLPTQGVRPVVPGFEGRRLVSSIDAELMARVFSTAAAWNISPFALLLAAFQLLLHRLTDQPRLVVGVPLAGQPHAGTPDLVGNCLSVVPVSSDLVGDPTFEAFARATAVRLSEAVEHAEAPLHEIAAALGATVAPGRFPFTTAICNMEHAPSALAFDGLDVDVAENFSGFVKSEIQLHITKRSDRLDFDWDYRSDLFEALVVRHWAAAFHTLLSQGVMASKTRVCALTVVGAAEAAQLRAWGAARRGAEEGKVAAPLVVAAVAAQAARTPTAVAVAAGAEALTYAALETQATAVAHFLRGLGVAPEVRVAVCLERRPAMVVAILGVLKAGGAYVPLDPALPPARLRLMMDDAQVAVVLTDAASVDRVPASWMPVCCVDSDGPAIAAAAPGALPVLAPDHAAYVIYTSGSTGTPKGVVVTHGGLSNYLDWAGAAYHVGAGGAPLHSSIGFDLSVTALLVPLLHGGCVTLVPHAEGPDALAALLAEQRRFDFVKVTPSHLTALAALLDPAAVGGAAGLLIVGGEALTTGHVAWWRQHAPALRIVNEYGPTETVVGCCVYDVPAGAVAASGAAVPIGAPIANTRVWVLDAAHTLTPLGVPGELYVGGAGVARGYLGQPALTAARFVPDPFSATGERLYRTGDRARWRSDGMLDYLGRLDDQIKLRGYRIEPGEVEATLRQVDGVAAAAVIAREDTPGDPSLVAYVVFAPDVPFDAAAVRAQLAATLPEYMLPAAFVPLDALPLTENGKVDRAALPAPVRPAIPAAADRPRDGIEETVAQVWSDVLNRASIGPHDNFFELGGHSLKAAQVLTRARSVFGIEVPLSLLFAEPTLAGMSAYLRERLSADRDLARLDADERSAAAPLSAAQQQIWIAHQLAPDSAAYNIPHVLRLNGELDASALRAALRALVTRHRTLRTTIDTTSAEPAAVLQPASIVRLVDVDLGALANAARIAASIARSDAARPFDLIASPPLRVTLVRVGPGDQRLLVTLHHIASDGWSTGVLMRDFAALHAAAASRQPAPLAPLEYHYADYAAAQRRALESGALDRQIDYWVRQLADFEPLELPYDRPRTRVPTSRRGARVTVSFDPALGKALDACSRQLGATPFMVVLAALQLLLMRYTGRRDAAVGTPFANRADARLEPLVGCFVNTLVLRARVSGGETFADVVRRGRDTVLEAYAHQAVPFETIVARLAPSRDASRNPLVDVIFVWQNAPTAPMTLGGVDWSSDVSVPLPNKADLTLSLGADSSGSLLGALDYAPELFEPQTVERFVANLRQVLAAGVQNPARAIESIALPADDERRLLETWSHGPARIAGSPMSIPARFDAHVHRAPDAVLLVDEDLQLTSAAVALRANRLAAHLRALGVRADTTVGVRMERRVPMVVAVLAVLKAGGCYVPLDPDWPLERQRFVAADAGLTLLLTAGDSGGVLPGLQVVDVDDELTWLHGADVAAAAVDGQGRQAAYVLYTSGSTGQPKGVVVEHRQIVSYIESIEVFTRWTSSLRLALVQPLAVDASATLIYFSLLEGARLHLVPRWTGLDGEACAAYLQHHLIDVVKIAPSHLMALQARARAAVLPATTLMLGGEPSESRWVATIVDAAAVAIINHYGPTETTVGVTAHRVSRRSFGGATVPIGRPLANSRAYIVDAATRLLPVGARGELLIGGEGVSRGYLNRPRLTAERFVPDPFAGGGARAYRTGDTCRWTVAGEIEYVGRSDDQIKIRGHRVEMGEIVAALTRDARVQDAVVRIQTDGDAGDGAGDRRELVAYALLHANVLGEFEAADADAATPVVHHPDLSRSLRAAVAAALPEPMVPAAVVLLRRWPLTAHGKRDLQALPPARFADEPSAPLTPRDGIEAIVAQIWSDVLGRAVALTDNFFDVGGHSLLATQLVARLRSVFDLTVPLRAVFDRPTVEGLAACVRALRARPDTIANAPPLRREDADTAPLSYAQERVWFLEQLSATAGGYVVQHHVDVDGALDYGAVRIAVTSIVARHEVLRTVFRERNGIAQQVVQPAHAVRVAVVDLSALRATSSAAAQIAQSDAARPFDLQSGPLIRIVAVNARARRHHLILTMHHILTDLWSLAIWSREFAELYEAARTRRPAALPPLAVQYADYARWQRAWLTGDRLDAELAYWRDQLAGWTPMALPVDRIAGTAGPYRAAREVVHLDASTRDAMQKIGRSHGVTLFMTLLAAAQALLARYTGQSDLTVGIPVANRTVAAVEPLIGMFVNTLVIRVPIDPGLTFAELLARTRRAVLDAYDHQDVPFEKVVEAVAPDRDGTQPPLLQVLFGLQTAPPIALDLSDARATHRPSASGSAKTPLIINCLEIATGVVIELEYAEPLFERETIAALARRYVRLMTAALATTDVPLSTLDVLTADERTLLLSRAGRPNAPLPETVHRRFERHAIERPDAVALSDGPQWVTYRALNARANRLGRELQRRGVQAERVVAIYLPRSIDFVVACLAALKAGGAYAPIDPGQPRDRLRFLLEDVGAVAAITTSALAADVAETPAILIDDHERAADDAANLTIEVAPEQLAVVMYTSGSSGRPKGTAIPHRSLAGFMADVSYAPFTHETVQLLHSALSWDASLLEWMPALYHGGRTVVVGDDRLTPDRLRLAAARDGVTVLWLAAAQFANVVDVDPHALDGVACVIVGGEAVSAAHVRRAQDVLPSLRIVDGYGPSECTVFSACYPIEPGFPGAAVPIGRPIGDRRVYLLDAGRGLAPPGAVAELCVGGPAVARGYLGRPRLTAEQFVPDPFGEPGTRLYATGDRARWRSDGVLEYVGRLDHQVKLRGYRIELGEVESAIRRCSGVDDVVVTLEDGRAAGPRLVAWVVGRTDAIPAWRAAVSEWLPGYMVPVEWIPIAAIPRNTRGKVDRSALAHAPRLADRDTVDARDVPVEPSTPYEEIVAGIWAHLLGAERVGLHDNFFDLGGHSLLATQVIARLRSVTDSAIPLDWIFETGTAKELAARIEAADAVRAAADDDAEGRSTDRLAYWQAQFKDCQAAALPFGRRRDLADDDRRERVSIELDAETAAAVRQVSRARGVTRFVTWVSAVSVLLSRYARQSDLTFVGAHGEPTLLRVRVDRESTFAELLERTCRTILDAHGRRGPTLEQIVGAIAPDRRATRVAWPPVAARDADASDPIGDVCFDCLETPSGLTIAVSYRPALFDRATMTAVVADQRTVLAAALASPDRPLSELAVTLAAPSTVALPPLSPIPSGRSDADAPLSLAQQRLWFLERLARDSAQNNVPCVVRARGPLSRRALLHALQELVERHESLRTVIVESREGDPRQHVQPPAAVALPVVDVSALAASGRDREARRLVGVDARRPFDLAAGPLWRALLVRVQDDEWMVALTLHHIICDAWSISVLIRELGMLYGAYPRRAHDVLPPLRLQYADYARWQHEPAQARAIEAQLEYWRGQLADTPPLLRLPTDHPRPAVQTFRGRRAVRRWPATLANALRALSRANDVTLFMALLAGFQALLARHSDERDICVGTPIANRTRTDLDGLIGFFVNTLVMRTDLSGDPTFRSLLQRVRSVARTAYANQDAPFERVVDEVRPDRALDRNPIFQVNFALQNAPRAALDVGALALEPIVAYNGTAKFDLTLTVVEVADGLAATLDGAVDLFEQGTIERLLDRLDLLLHDAVARPDTRLSELRILTAAERAALRAYETGAPAAPAPAVHDAIACRAHEAPDAIAVSEPLSLTFEALNASANRLAEYLRRAGVGTESCVGVHLARSPEMVIAVLGILKAGGTFVPLDPSYPAARLRIAVDESRILVVLTRGGRCTFSLPEWARTIDLDADRHAIRLMPDHDPDRTTHPAQLACIMYTSGSTGRPKGVMMTHGGLASYLSWAASGYPVHAGYAAPVHSPLAFDLTFTSLLVPLAAGAAITLLPDDSDPAALAAGCGFSIVKITPAHLHALGFVARPPTAPPWATAIVSGGEALTAAHLSGWLRQTPSLRVFNEYGPTETVVGCCVFEVSSTELPEHVPIGRPIANMVMRVLDGQLRDVPIGVAGEIFIGGVGVARGYMGRPALTAERFLPDPFSDVPGSRLYRSGDIGRCGPDGNFVYIARADDQVKVRGYRIELGEVELALCACPNVQDAAAVVRRSGDGEGVLVAYFVGPAATADDVRRDLEERLPRYMVPSQLVRLPALPLTRTGKVDRAALPLPAGNAAPPVAPRNDAERRMLDIWRTVLAQPTLGVADDFFAVGGHSLQGVRLMAQIEQVFGQRVPVRTLFAHRTAARLTEYVGAQAMPPPRPHAVVAIQPEGSMPALFAVHPLGGDVMGYQALADRLGRTRPFIGIEAPSLADIGAYEEDFATIEERAASYIEMIRGVQPHGPYLIAGYSFGGVVAFEIACQLEARGDAVALVALLDTAVPDDRPIALSDLQIAAGLAKELFIQRQIDWALDLAVLAPLPGDRQLDAIVRELVRIGALSGARDPDAARDHVGRMLTGFRRRMEAMRRYRPARFGGRVTLLRAEMHALRRAVLDDRRRATIDDPTRGWAALAAGGLQVIALPGYHETMLQPPHVDVLADALDRCIGDGLAVGAPADLSQ